MKNGQSAVELPGEQIPDINLNEVVFNKINKVLNENLDAILEAKVKSFVDQIFNEVFSSYGGLGNDLKNIIQDKLKVNLENVKVEQYNERVIQIVNQEIGRFLDERANAKIAERLRSELVILEKTEWKLSEIVKEFVKVEWSDREESFTPTIIVMNGSYDNIRIGLDPEAGKQIYNCAYQLNIDSKDKKVWNYEIRGVFGAKGKNSSVIGPIDKLIFGLYANQADITIDDDYETEYYRDRD